MSEETDESDSGPPLERMGDIQREMARVYRSMKAKRMPTADGFMLVQTLSHLAKVTQIAQEHDAIERLERLERQREGISSQAS